MDLDEWQRWWKVDGRDGLNRILRRDWNPIGVWVPENEYAGYAGQLGRLLREQASLANIVASLNVARTEDMGLPPRPEIDQQVASMLVEWYAHATSEAE